MKSNWISYKKYINGKYMVHNHLLDNDTEMTIDEIELIESLDGKINPNKILRQEFGMTRSEAANYVDMLIFEGILRQGNRVLGMLSMRTMIKLYNSSKYRKIAIVLFGLIMISFVPILVAGVNSAYKIFILYDFMNFKGDTYGPSWAGIVIGLIGGVVFHELNHAIACCAFGGLVMEFGIVFRGFPAAYTLIDCKNVSRWGQIIIDLFGVMANLMISAISMIMLYNHGAYMNVFTLISAVNLAFALANILFIEGIDGCNAITKIIGFSDVYEKCNTHIKKLKPKESNSTLSETDKTVANMIKVFGVSKLIYPILILFNLCVIFGW